MIFTKVFFIPAFLMCSVSTFVKHNLPTSNYIYTKTDRFRRKRKKINYRLHKSKDEDIESCIPHIYKDIAPSLKGLTDEEYSYKQLLNAYFPETVEREIEKKKEKELKQKNEEKGICKNSAKKEGVMDGEKDMEEKLRENDITNFEDINKISDHKKKNKILDIAYDSMEDSLRDIYLRMKSGVGNEEEDKKDYLEIAKKEKDMLYEKLICGYSPLNNSSTFDLFGVFYDSKDYEDGKKLLAEMNKMLNLEPLKSNRGNILQTVDTLLKKNNLPPHIRNFLIKYRHIAEEVCGTREDRKDAVGDEKTEDTQIEQDVTQTPGGERKNEEYLELDDPKTAAEVGKGIKKEEYLKDVNKVIMTLHNNLNNEKLMRRDQYFVDELYDAYKKHLRTIHVKRNKLEPQKNNYDFLTFFHEHYEEYFFFKYGNFAYDFEETVEKVKEKMENEKGLTKTEDAAQFSQHGGTGPPVENQHMEGDKKPSSLDMWVRSVGDPTESRYNEDKGTRAGRGKNPNEKCSILKGIKQDKKLRKHILMDIIHNYQKRMYDIYKPNNIITNAYGFNNYIDNEQYEKEINASFNKYSILNYDSKEDLNKVEKLYVGKLIFGKIFKIEKTYAYVDINYAFYAELHEDQMPYNIKNMKDVFKVNDKLVFEIYKMYPEKILLTLKNIQKVNDLNKILHYKTQDMPFDVKVVTILKNGISVSYNDIYAFIHISALSSKYKVKVEENEKIQESLLNQKIKVICTDISKLNFSNLIYEQNEQLKKLNIYDIVQVEIIHISKYGLMVKCDDIVGLIHISEISKKKIDDLNDVFKIGDQLKGVLINIDYDNKRFSLSTKILETEGRNFIDDRAQIYDNMEFILEDIKKRNTSLRINDSNIKNQLLSLIDIYKTEDGDSKSDGQADIAPAAGADTHQGKIDRGEADQGENDRNDTPRSVELTKRTNNPGDGTDRHTTCKGDQDQSTELAPTDLRIENDQIKRTEGDNRETETERFSDDLDETEEEEKELTIDINNQLVPYLMLKQDEIAKEEEEESVLEKPREIIWNLEDEEFLNSNSPTQSTQFFEYQWSYLKDKKWVNFAYYVNRIMNYYFNINDDFFTYKEKNVVYEIDFVKGVRIDLATGLQNRIRKITK
ncbi:RNA-binding protein, putative [Plasmodium knowlesi strain H]|uniref:RNA-binding protein, putative n=3 Tax=Plasmodium knowlesi TaxID=5850 RepID=A0A5K1TUL2_PLAKH|nr:RNA-binding protein, putative [Plasmodium knowlesi strain H]OTN63816.1 putative RNA-binding protein [Plasmodium knowlesi]CAA9990885.1 RNA-binding protein, putative [Plasmodium knowlesi strain H]SBO20891.1 RNA-binding protein, putative [Plasmodium knowlesi strain H]SBO21356.1 RNA-binding protein, putative [Plasmodium knowlesi strain H]VVS80359.1 RNA-binding protein, putative [Plasmodium knowlesi strain H]|eukprot:XP_002262171.1 RNA-binding protein, putative [Plasmodium knowlesi strain H]